MVEVALFAVGRKRCPECLDPGDDRRPPFRQVRDQPVDLGQLVLQIGQSPLAGSRPLVVEAGSHRKDFPRGEPGRDQVADPARAPDVGLAIRAVPVRAADRIDQAHGLVVAQRPLADAEPRGRFPNLHHASLSGAS
jgi:hypothetical protein